MLLFLYEVVCPAPESDSGEVLMDATMPKILHIVTGTSKSITG